MANSSSELTQATHERYLVSATGLSLADKGIDNGLGSLGTLDIWCVAVTEVTSRAMAHHDK